jgi:hypothetical protein
VTLTGGGRNLSCPFISPAFSKCLVTERTTATKNKMDSNEDCIELTDYQHVVVQESSPPNSPPKVLVKGAGRLAESATNWRYALEGWRLYTLLDSRPVTLLGQHYDPGTFGLICSQIPWVTYRSDFNPIYSLDERENTLTEIRSDVGWGCTVRVGQMMLLTSLQRAIGCKRWPNYSLLKQLQEYWPQAPFSLHRVAELAAALKVKAGDWHSPSSVCFALEVRPT